MKKKTVLFFICATTALSQIVYAQDSTNMNQKSTQAAGVHPKNNLVPVKGAPLKGVGVSLGKYPGGGCAARSAMKDSSFIKSGLDIEVSGYIPLFRKKLPGRMKPGTIRITDKLANNQNSGYKDGEAFEMRQANTFSLGIEPGIEYMQMDANGAQSAYNNAFQIQDAVINSAFQGNKPKASFFQVFIGPKAEWDLGKVYVSPSVLFGYSWLNRKSYTLSGNIVNPNQPAESKNLELVSANGFSTSGFIIKPKIELGYYFTNRFSVFINGNMSFGPSFQNNFSYWKPQGESNGKGSYSYDQFNSGTTQNVTYHSPWQVWVVNFGIGYSFHRF